MKWSVQCWREIPGSVFENCWRHTSLLKEIDADTSQDENGSQASNEDPQMLQSESEVEDDFQRTLVA